MPTHYAPPNRTSPQRFQNPRATPFAGNTGQLQAGSGAGSGQSRGIANQRLAPQTWPDKSYPVPDTRSNNRRGQGGMYRQGHPAMGPAPERNMITDQQYPRQGMGDTSPGFKTSPRYSQTLQPMPATGYARRRAFGNRYGRTTRDAASPMAQRRAALMGRLANRSRGRGRLYDPNRQQVQLSSQGYGNLQGNTGRMNTARRYAPFSNGGSSRRRAVARAGIFGNRRG